MTTDSETCFATETSSWSTNVTDKDSSISSKCGETFLLGGFDWSPNIVQTYGSLKRLYTDLPNHEYIVFTFSVWAIDSWDFTSSSAYDRFELQFDSLPAIQGWGMKWEGFTTQLCGKTNYNDAAGLRAFGWIEHSSDSLLLQFRSRMDQASLDESFGIREIKMLFTGDEPSGSSFCAYTGSVPIYQQTTCACPTGEYSGDNGCENCHENCESCYGSGSDKCYACAKGTYFDGSKCNSCDSSCSECNGSGAEECTACDVGYILFNGKCIAETRCVSPMVLVGECVNECQSSCASQEMSLWEEDCFPPCPDKEISNLDAECIRKNKFFGLRIIKE